jgi:hypothetical protein
LKTTPRALAFDLAINRERRLAGSYRFSPEGRINVFFLGDGYRRILKRLDREAPTATDHSFVPEDVSHGA